MSRRSRHFEQSQPENRPTAQPSSPDSLDRAPIDTEPTVEPAAQLEQIERLCESAALDATLDAVTNTEANTAAIANSPTTTDRDSEPVDLDASWAELRRAERRLKADREELNDDRERLDRKLKRIEERETELEAEQERLAAEKAETKVQRRRIAAELQAQRAEITAARSNRPRDDKANGPQAEQVATQSTELSAVRAECEKMRAEAAEWSEEQALWRQAQTLWMNERQETAAKLNAAEARIQSLEKTLQAATEKGTAPAVDPADAQRISDLKRRFELAVQDVRELKRQNAELQDQLSESKSQGPSSAAPDASLDWESQKRRLLAVLEKDDADDNPRRAEQRLSLEGAIHITDEVVAQRDRELAELKLKLQNLESRSQLAQDDPLAADRIDRDEIVQKERAKLRELQDQWREKLRQAEIDLSLERAKIARDKAEIEEKLSAHAKRTENQSAAKTGEGNGESQPKPARGRWLSRLGLKDDDA